MVVAAKKAFWCYGAANDEQSPIVTDLLMTVGALWRLSLVSAQRSAARAPLTRAGSPG